MYIIHTTSRHCAAPCYIGNIDAFDENVEQWATYVDRFEHFVKASDIEEDKKVAVFLSVMGAATYGLLRSLIAPDKPGEKSYEDTGFHPHFSVGNGCEKYRLTGRKLRQSVKRHWRECYKGTVKSLKKELGTLRGTEAAITLKLDHQPRFCQARVVPYDLRPKVEAEIDRLCEEGIVSPVKFSEWATPIVPIVKKNGDVRICGDFKLTVNPALCVEKYPIPLFEDGFASLSGGQHFSKLDLSHAYLQMAVEEKSRKYLTITTSKGLFCYNRLAFGITSSPAIFQRAMDQVLQCLPNVHCYLDDILITGQDRVQHLKNLDAVLGLLEEFGLRVEKEKCEFFKDSLEYLGHTIDAHGLHKSPEKVRAIVEAPAPTDVR
ncbi:hypothetical protein AOLI_G00055280 [Acnodon oligacanthus]